ncbi:O-antigen translocase [Rheinheimera fenheensis]|uniref:O-antigen translocase n=1 Tax=Rheinheimera fenheensis TaxID=3152295 RepID=UPI00326154E2
MTLIKTSLLNGLAVIVRMATLLGLNKILAVYVGPSGYALIGQLQNAMVMMTTVASGSINTGVTKYTAELRNNDEKTNDVWKTSFNISMLLSFTLAIGIYFFSFELSSYFFHNTSYEFVFTWFAVTLPFFVLNSLLMSILNGRKEVVRYIKVNIFSAIFSLMFTGALTMSFGIKGALVALVTNQSIVLLVTIFLLHKTEWFGLKRLVGFGKWKVTQDLSKFALMTIVSVISVPLSHIAVRQHLVSEFGMEHAGYWDAMWKISTVYLMLVTTTLSLYYLPRLSEIKAKEELRSEILYGYKIIMPIVIVVSMCSYLLKELVVKILFSNDFLEMMSLFGWQMFGDTVKIASWLLAFVYTAKGLAKIHIFSQILFSFSFYFLTVFFCSIYGFDGVAISHAANYIAYSIFVFISLKFLKVI